MTKLPIPDLLHAQPREPVSHEDLRQSTSFALESGDMESVLSHLAERGAPTATRFRAECFAKELFLDELVQHCFPVHVAGRAYEAQRRFIVRVISAPPADGADVEYRQSILRELAEDTPELAGLERLHVALQSLRGQLCTPSLSRWESGTQRRLEVLKAYVAVVDVLGKQFAGARSGLSRLAALGHALERSELYDRVTELLEYEDHLADVDVSLRLGLDGRVRGVKLLQVAETRGNRFYQSAFLRFAERLLLFFRGYRFAEDELLARLVDTASADLEDQLLALLPLSFEVEFYIAAVGFRRLAEKHGLKVCLPTFVGEEAPARVSIERLFNPLLFIQGITPEPCSVSPEASSRIVVLTGPNSGGKTRLLQALGLTQLLGQAGLYVPAAEATLERLDGAFVSLSESATVDQREGRLGTELLRIRRLFEQASGRSLVLLDELCSGTNPSEGEEIIELVLDLLLELDPRVVLTTHFLRFAEQLADKPPIAGLEFWQVDLDENELPTYQFKPGVAQTSLAQKTASRLGVTRAELLELVHKTRRAVATVPR